MSLVFKPRAALLEHADCRYAADTPPIMFIVYCGGVHGARRVPSHARGAIEASCWSGSDRHIAPGARRREAKAVEPRGSAVPVVSAASAMSVCGCVDGCG